MMDQYKDKKTPPVKLGGVPQTDSVDRLGVPKAQIFDALDPKYNGAQRNPKGENELLIHWLLREPYFL